MTANGGDAGLAVKPVVPLPAGQTYSPLAHVCPVKAESYCICLMQADTKIVWNNIHPCLLENLAYRHN